MSTEANEGGIVIPGNDVRASRHPALRDAVDTFISHVDPAMTEAVLQQVLDADDGRHIPGTVDLFVRERPLNMNPVVSAEAVCQELLLMNSKKLWRSLLVEAAKKNRAAIAGFAGLKPLMEEGELLTTMSELLNTGNSILFTGTLIHSGMAAVYGEQFYPDVMTSTVKRYSGDLTRYIPEPRFQAGMEVSKLFPLPALSVDETIARLQTLFPANASSSEASPVFRAAKAKKAFTNVTPHKVPQAVSCPADNMTGMLFTAYGNILARPEYQAKLRGKFAPLVPGRRT